MSTTNLTEIYKISLDIGGVMCYDNKTCIPYREARLGVGK
jgi:hypothetical protein